MDVAGDLSGFLLHLIVGPLRVCLAVFVLLGLVNHHLEPIVTSRVSPRSKVRDVFERRRNFVPNVVTEVGATGTAARSEKIFEEPGRDRLADDTATDIVIDLGSPLSAGRVAVFVERARQHRVGRVAEAFGEVAAGNVTQPEVAGRDEVQVVAEVVSDLRSNRTDGLHGHRNTREFHRRTQPPVVLFGRADREHLEETFGQHRVGIHAGDRCECGVIIRGDANVAGRMAEVIRVVLSAPEPAFLQTHVAEFGEELVVGDEAGELHHRFGVVDRRVFVAAPQGLDLRRDVAASDHHREILLAGDAAGEDFDRGRFLTNSQIAFEHSFDLVVGDRVIGHCRGFLFR